MSKSILLSIRPEWVLKILTHKKTIEVRKQFPNDYVGWVYIYCTKGVKHQELAFDETTNEWKLWYGSYSRVNSKVVARFWCDKVEETFYQKAQNNNELDNILKNSCLNDEELWNYVENRTFYAIHISKLEIFDEPKELSEFTRYGKPNKYDDLGNSQPNMLVLQRLTKAPQNYCYVEGEE